MSRFLPRMLCLPAILALLTVLGCTNDAGGGGLHVFDQGSSSVLVWHDLDQVHDAARDGKPLPKADRTIKSSLLSGITLAWGGMALDDDHHRLYLVSEAGKVYVITNPRSKDGALTARGDILSFSLGGESDRFSSGSVFGQASVDSTRNVLYVMENARNGDAARIWQVGNASMVPNGNTLAKAGHTFSVEGDKWGAGLAAGHGHKVFGLFGHGPQYDASSGNGQVTGPRLREALDGTFPSGFGHNHPIHTLIGGDTGLPPLRYGSLAYSGRDHSLYVLVPPSGTADPAILVFREHQFRGQHNQPPAWTMPGVPRDLRFIAHPMNSHWMAGAGFSPAAGTEAHGRGNGQRTLYLWKAANEAKPHVAVQNLPGVADIRGLAISAL
ncbi:MAG: hypothetical protein P4L36_21715 [Holophaga sp.]|nr:hypothetical protein [Holophaga sp.]